MSSKQDNIFILASEKATKKGTGINAILGLLKDFVDFQDKLCVAMEAQDIAENRQKLEAFCGKMEEMYEELLNMARGGVRSVRKPMQQAPRNPVMLNDNTIQRLPR